MMPRTPLYEYRAWPSGGMPHVAAVHHIFGLGVAEIRTDTYVVLPKHSQCLMIVRGGTQFELKVKTGVQAPVSTWKTPMRSPFPLRRSVVRMLQEVFPTSELPHRISAPVDLISWLGRDASIFTVSKRMVHFQSAGCTAELTQVDTHGYRAETFCLTAKRYDTVVETLGMIPGPRLPNLDYGSWLQRRILGTSPTPVPQIAPILQDARKAELESSWRAALLTLRSA
ncbi:MAG: hypothetical protein Q8S09_14180 [Hyphomonas sp.]|nr:hypothetical protein [Hyphomonas sp.]